MATRALSRRDFVIKDVAISIGGGGGTWMPGPDDETPPTPISPIASVVVNLALIEAVRGTMVQAVKDKKFDDVAAAFVAGGTGGNPAIRAAIQQIGASVVAAARYAALGGGGEVGLVNPDCGGTSFETIPPTLTPVVHVGLAVHRVAELPRLRQQLAQAVAFVDKASVAQAPRGAEVASVAGKLKETIANLGG